MKFPLSKPDQFQKKLLASILSDAGKLFFGAGVVGYFIPDLNQRLSFGVFIITFFMSVFLFTLAVLMIRKTHYDES